MGECGWGYLFSTMQNTDRNTFMTACLQCKKKKSNSLTRCILPPVWLGLQIRHASVKRVHSFCAGWWRPTVASEHRIEASLSPLFLCFKCVVMMCFCRLALASISCLCVSNTPSWYFILSLVCISKRTLAAFRLHKHAYSCLLVFGLVGGKSKRKGSEEECSHYACLTY